MNHIPLGNFQHISCSKDNYSLFSLRRSFSFSLAICSLYAMYIFQIHSPSLYPLQWTSYTRSLSYLLLSCLVLICFAIQSLVSSIYWKADSIVKAESIYHIFSIRKYTSLSFGSKSFYPLFNNAFRTLEGVDICPIWCYTFLQIDQLWAPSLTVTHCSNLLSWLRMRSALIYKLDSCHSSMEVKMTFSVFSAFLWFLNNIFLM